MLATASWSAGAEGHGASLPRRHRFDLTHGERRPAAPGKRHQSRTHSKRLRDFSALWSLAAADGSMIPTVASRRRMTVHMPLDGQILAFAVVGVDAAITVEVVDGIVRLVDVSIPVQVM